MKKQAFNPYLPLDTYIPDGEPHVFGDRVYIYGSHDAEDGDCFCLLDYECWSAPVDDLSDWRCEGIIYRAEQCAHYSKERQDMHAPLMKLAMPKAMSGIFSKPVSEIKAEEPQSILGANLVELCDDMLTVKGEPVRILPALNNAPKGSELRAHSFYEAASLRKFNDKYYFIYSSHVNHELCYATSRFPDRDYTYRGVIITLLEGETQ